MGCIPKTLDLLETPNWLRAVVWNTLPCCVWFLFQNCQDCGLNSKCSKTDFKLRLVVILLMSPLRKAAKHRGEMAVV